MTELNAVTSGSSTTLRRSHLLAMRKLINTTDEGLFGFKATLYSGEILRRIVYEAAAGGSIAERALRYPPLIRRQLHCV